MKDKHEMIEIDLMDAYYGEKELSDDLKKHLDDCPQCSAFWKDLNALGAKLSEIDTEIEVDERIIKRAFSQADKIKSKHVEQRDFALFLCMAVTFLLTGVWLAYNGYAVQIMAVQLFCMAAVPLSIPFLIWRRLVKEGK